MRATDWTHEAIRTSWVDSAESPDTDFPITHLPWCVFERADGEKPRIGVGIGECVLAVGEVARRGLFSGLAEHRLTESQGERLQSDDLGPVLAASPTDWRAYRHAFAALLARDCPLLRDDARVRQEVLHRLSEVRLRIPAAIGDYTDFYASIYHATNVGSMFRPDNPLLPNYRWVPIAYHGRGSSIVPSGTHLRRPMGQMAPAVEGQLPGFRPSRMLDYELEVAIWIGGSNPLGEPIPIGRAEERFFGLSLLNDWSARDIQKWEYQPLGPFLAKNFGTTISPWITPREALAPFRVPAFPRSEEEPPPLSYLCDETDQQSGGVALTLEVFLSTQSMRERGMPPARVSRGSFRDLYWTIAQMIAHHAVNGCNLQPGDVLGSGTVSGVDRDSRGCLLELTWDGGLGNPLPGTQRTPLKLPDGSERTFLADGDEVILRGFCEAPGFRRIGLGECRGVIESARV